MADLKIEDYLPFYIGCPILICEPGVAPVYHHELEGYDRYLNKAIAERVNYPAAWIKPILYKQSDNDWHKLMPNVQQVESRHGEGFLPFAEWTFYSIKNGVDMFGLIDAGLAVWIKEIHLHYPPEYWRIEISTIPKVYNPNRLKEILGKIAEVCAKFNR